MRLRATYICRERSRKANCAIRTRSLFWRFSGPYDFFTEGLVDKQAECSCATLRDEPKCATVYCAMRSMAVRATCHLTGLTREPMQLSNRFEVRSRCIR